MGTSSIFNGPINPLLPADYNDVSSDSDDSSQTNDGLDMDTNNEQSETNEIDNDEPGNLEHPGQPAYRWKDAKTEMTNYVKGKTSDRGKIMNRYVSAAGGSRQISRLSSAGRTTAIGIGRLIQDFKNNGVESTLERLQIDCVGKGAKAVLSELVNVISQKADSKEDIIARGAASEVIAEMYKIVEENGGDIEALRQIDEVAFRNILEIFMSEYIFRKVMNDLQSRFEKYENDPREAVKKEQELKDYIKVKVELRIKELRPETYDYKSRSIFNEIEKLFVKCFQVFEDYI